jgi:hypothetical protein
LQYTDSCLLYTLDIVHYIKQHEQFLEQNAQIHKYDTRRRQDLHVHLCNTDLFRKSDIDGGIRLYNRVRNYIKKLEKDKAFKRELRSSLLQHTFYSVDEYTYMYVILISCVLCDCVSFIGYIYLLQQAFYLVDEYTCMSFQLHVFYMTM